MKTSGYCHKNNSKQQVDIFGFRLNVLATSFHIVMVDPNVGTGSGFCSHEAVEHIIFRGEQKTLHESKINR